MFLHCIASVLRLGYRLVVFLTACMAVIMFCFSGYVLYDTFYLNRTAYTSFDLLQYKPKPKEAETAGFELLCEMNPDVVGWLEIPDTHINYPVLHGEDDLQYAYTDAYGNPNMNGSIYLAATNHASFAECYMMLYGHNMANGGMFGDLKKYEDSDYFKNHQSGLLTTKDAVYTIMVYACIETDAYESMVYTLGNRDTKSMEMLDFFIREHATYYEDLPGTETSPVLALSTCSTAFSYGRTVVFAKLVPKNDCLAFSQSKGKEEEGMHPVVRKAVGHEVDNHRFSVVDLVAVLSMAYFLLPVDKCLCRFRAAFRKDLWAKAEKTGKMRAGILAEGIILCAGACTFILTQNLHDPMTLVDTYTPLMLLLMAVDLCFDRVFFGSCKDF